jgi:hypothetical protein
MLREAENRIKIEGILSEIDLKYGSFQKDGKTNETIGGIIKIRVDQEINKQPVTNEIPVHMFATKYTKKGTISPAYENIEKVMKEYISIAAAGGEAGADRVRITNGKLQMNEYYNQQGQFVSFPRITTSFMAKATGEFKPEATFTLEFAVSNMAYEVDKDGIEVEPKKLKITAILPQYGGKVDVINLHAVAPGVIDAIEQYWEKDATFKANGRLNFTSKTETVYEEVDFGEPVERVRTTTLSELIITGGSQAPLEGDHAFDVDDIIAAMTERKTRLENLKNKNIGKAAPAEVGKSTNKSIAEAGKDLGF